MPKTAWEKGMWMNSFAKDGNQEFRSCRSQELQNGAANF
jgi:hypothetical protein